MENSSAILSDTIQASRDSSYRYSRRHRPLAWAPGSRPGRRPQPDAGPDGSGGFSGFFELAGGWPLGGAPLWTLW